MNSRQLTALWIGMAISVGLILYPPHYIMPNIGNLLASMMPFVGNQAPPPVLIQYGFIFSPPPGSTGIDWQRFWLPEAGVILMTLAGIAALTGRGGSRGRVASYMP